MCAVVSVAIVMRFLKRPTYEIMLDNIILFELSQTGKPSQFNSLALNDLVYETGDTQFVWGQGNRIGEVHLFNLQ